MKSQPGVVLALHHSPPRFSLAPMAVSIPALRRILGSLLDAGYRFAALDEVGPSGPPPGAIALTADDGYASQVAYLSPLLRELGVPWGVFVLVGQLGGTNRWDVGWVSPRERHLTVDEVRWLAGEGVAIGSHGITHRRLTSLPDGALAEELVASRERLERITGRPVDAIAYPWGAADARVTAAAGRAGYRLGFGPRRRGQAGADPLQIPRTALYAPDQIHALFAATALRAPGPLQVFRAGLAGIGRGLIGVAVAARGSDRG